MLPENDPADDAARSAVEGNSNPATPTPPAPAPSSPQPEQEPASHKLGAELVYCESVLNKHGLSVAAMLASVAQHFHGVTIPPYSTTREG